MDIVSAQTFLSYLNILALVVQLFLLTYIYRHRKMLEQEDKVRHLLPDIHLIDETRERSDEILSGAVKQADAIIAEAELKGINLFAKQKQESDKVSKTFQEEMDSFKTAMEESLKTSLQRSEEAYAELMKVTNTAIQQHLSENQTSIHQKATELIDGTQHTLNTFISELQSTVKDQMNKELASARRYAEEYKQRKIANIDENVVELVEKTIAIVLGKTVFLKDQTDLVYKALEKAKSEHVFST